VDLHDDGEVLGSGATMEINEHEVVGEAYL
jgi:hypothetical protein